MIVDLDHFEREVICTYRGEVYRARDNGAVFRCHRRGSRRRPLDGKWTFGRTVKNSGYMFIGATRVHRVVATAFHGPEPTENHVVDHIDNNQRNNRPENLRWVTRLENALNNPITLRKIEIAYGSLEKFLENPSQPLQSDLPKNYEWMRTVTKEEANESYKNHLDWSQSGRFPSGGKLNEGIYKSRSWQAEERPDSIDLIESKTPAAFQRNWKWACEFPHCPSEVYDGALAEYCERLVRGEVFSRNDYGESIVEKAELSKDTEALVVLCKTPSSVKKWALSRVYVENKHFVHESRHSYFELDGATKYYTLERGFEWNGGTTFDDLC